MDMVLGLLIAAAILGGFIWLVAKASKKSEQRLRAAPKGSRRIESVKTHWLNQTLQKYADAGWTVEQQSTAKSLGSTARVTVTFVKQ